MKRREGREIDDLRIEGVGSSFVMGDREIEAEGDGNGEGPEAGASGVRPETVHPPRVKDCNCEVGLFKQLRETVARGEVMERSFLAAAADEQRSGAFYIEFEHGQLQDNGRDWRGQMNEELRKLAEALMFSGKFSVLMVGGQMLGTGYWEDFVQAKACKQ